VPDGEGALLVWPPGNVKRGLRFARQVAKIQQMSQNPEQQTREQRLAARLRENLRRRKVQAREIAREGDARLSKSEADG
jgi:chorismate mutase